MFVHWELWWCFFVLQWKKNWIIFFMQLGEARGKDSIRAACRERYRGRLNVLCRDFCWKKERRELMGREATARRSVFMRRTRVGGWSGCINAKRCTTTTSETTSARMTRKTGIFRSMLCLDWVASSGGRCLLALREKTFSWKTHDEKTEEEFRIAERAKT